MASPHKPTAVKQLQGTLNPTRANKAEPKASAIDLPAPPADLTPDEVEAWQELAKAVDPMRISTAADLVSFREMAETLGMIRALRKSLYASGPLVDSTGKMDRLRPEIGALSTQRQLLGKQLARWGMTPADRQRVSVLNDDANKDDALKKFRIV